MAPGFALQPGEEALYVPRGYVEGTRTPPGFYLTSFRVLELVRPSFGSTKMTAINLENIDSIAVETKAMPGLLVGAAVMAMLGLFPFSQRSTAPFGWMLLAGAGVVLLCFLIMRARLLVVHSGRSTIRTVRRGPPADVQRLVDEIQAAKQRRYQRPVPTTEGSGPTVQVESSLASDDTSTALDDKETFHPKYVELRALFKLRQEGVLSEDEFAESKRVVLGLPPKNPGKRGRGPSGPE